MSALAKSVGVQFYSGHFGQPTHDDQRLFLLLTVGVFQAGLSWQAAASKIPVFQQRFANFDPQVVAAFTEPDVAALAADPEMIRNPRKIRAVVQNAQAILAVQKEFGSFATYLWRFADDQPYLLAPDYETERTSALGSRVAKDMKRRHFTFVGPIVTHMFLRAAGIIQISS